MQIPNRLKAIGDLVHEGSYIADIGAVVAALLVVERQLHEFLHGNPVAVGEDVRRQVHAGQGGVTWKAPACAAAAFPPAGEAPRLSSPRVPNLADSRAASQAC